MAQHPSPAQALAVSCPTWCSGEHLPADAGVAHASTDRRVVAAFGPERRILLISVEGDSTGTAVRVSGAGSAPMSPAQALELAAALKAAALEALSGVLAA
jgi:hypothetical protein